MVGELEDSRREEPPFVLAERPMLEGWLEYHRTTLLLKCEGLDDAARKRQPVPGSTLSLHGLVRHMAEVERAWFQRVLSRRPDLPLLWFDPTNEDSDLAPVDDADWDTDLALWTAECDAGRSAAAVHQLEDTGIKDGRPCSLRWIYVHMIEEYARHNGHANLIRELIDGSVGR
jgi:uncharacterized damage-inducible protein DinB